MKLVLFENNIGQKGVESFSLALNQLNNLNSLELDLRYIIIEDEGAHLIVSSLSQLNNTLNSLKLEFYENIIQDAGFASLTCALGKLKNLNYLDLYFGFNNIKEVKSLFSAISQLKNLSYLILDLSSNSIVDQELESISSSFS